MRKLLILFLLALLIECDKQLQPKVINGEKNLIINMVGPAAFVVQEKIDSEAGVKMPDWFIDAFFENAALNDLNSIIKQLPEGVSELMCHPGRAGEREVLTDPEVRNNLNECHVRLAGFYSVK